MRRLGRVVREVHGEGVEHGVVVVARSAVLLLERLEERRFGDHGEAAEREARDAVHHEGLDVAVLEVDFAEGEGVEAERAERDDVARLVPRDLARPVVHLERQRRHATRRGGVPRGTVPTTAAAAAAHERLVGRGLGEVEGGVRAALATPAPRDPHVRRPRVEHDRQHLRRRPDADRADVLVVEVVDERQVAPLGRVDSGRRRELSSSSSSSSPPSCLCHLF
mmetsp:Transcript_6402/g.26922  ORF Transcript_6402/g.26922 Transcript_6402/m.26922 type:complete len:222 (+) Transcript_6402:1142-1807(+)